MDEEPRPPIIVENDFLDNEEEMEQVRANHSIFIIFFVFLSWIS